MRQECRDRFRRQRGLAIPTCITARAWRTSRDACRDRWLAVPFDDGGRENVPGIPGAWATRNITYLVRGPSILLRVKKQMLSAMRLGLTDGKLNICHWFGPQTPINFRDVSKVRWVRGEDIITIPVIIITQNVRDNYLSLGRWKTDLTTNQWYSISGPLTMQSYDNFMCIAWMNQTHSYDHSPAKVLV